MTTKKWYQSKQNWLNILMGILGVTVLINDDILTSLGLPEKSKAAVLSIIGAVNIIGNLILRNGVMSPISTLPSGTKVAGDVAERIAFKKAENNPDARVNETV